MNYTKNIKKLKESSLKFVLGNLEEDNLLNLYKLIKNDHKKYGEIIIENSTEAGVIYFDRELKRIKVLSVFSDDYYEIYSKSDFIKILEFIKGKLNITDIDFIIPIHENLLN